MEAMNAVEGSEGAWGKQSGEVVAVERQSAHPSLKVGGDTAPAHCYVIQIMGPLWPRLQIFSEDRQPDFWVKAYI